MQLLVGHFRVKLLNMRLIVLLGLGGGGLATPEVSNISNALRYALLAISMYPVARLESLRMLI